MNSFFILLLYFQYSIVHSVIPSLSVHKTDRRIIARKRQDTFEMCRIFTEENDKIRHNNEHNSLYANVGSGLKSRRVKRGVADRNFAINPTLNDTDVQRVESIVDKLYDELEEKGETVKYRQLNISRTISTTKNSKLVTARRFNFAPAELLGPIPTSTSITQTKNSVTEIVDESSVRFPLGIVPYFIDSRTYDADLADVIVKAFDYFEKATCIRLQRLRERPTDKDSLKNVGWLYIANPSGIRQCVHSNERRKSEGVQMVVFGYDCMSLGDIAHEIMHILGFSHEHTRSDRDQYITVMWDNIKPGYKKYFDINKNQNQNLMESLPYDYSSVLHYPSRAFSKNGQLTIVVEPGTKIGQREGLSETDIEKVGLLYSNECVKRNRDYLLKTCPSVVRVDTKLKNITQNEIENYFNDRLWPFGIVHYKLRDKMEFSAEERENIRAVIRHIEKETCLEFKDITALQDNIDTEILTEPDHETVDNSYKTDISTSSKKPPSQYSIPLSDVPTGNKLKDSKNEFKESDNVMQSSENEMKSTESKIKHLGNAQEQSENSIKESESDMKKSENEIKQSESELTQSESNIKQSENEIEQSGLSIKQSENSFGNSEKDIKNETKNMGIVNIIQKSDKSSSKTNTASTTDGNILSVNATEQIHNDDLYDEKNTGDHGGHIVKLYPKKNMNDRPPAENHSRHTNTTYSYLKRLRMGKNINKSKQIINKTPKVVKQKATKAKRLRRSVRAHTQSRRHANNIILLTRSSEPGCVCPKPGRPNGNKILTINKDCFNSVNDLLHLFVHVLGLDHQHNMHDRDSYLHIVWDKLSPDIREEIKLLLPPAASVGFPYDYQSVMHYPWLQIKNGVTNIMYPIWNDGWAMGHWQGLSSTDVQKLNLLYFNECVARSQKMNMRFKQ